ncbi:hypothetical protein [Thermonema rossianum]|uniref:hypothetical protein n=1 Tax=Thermonema rossianum TaxID=55505 RepID=UPI00056FC89C|nr:hypothetical protein [Thermonema rossianum]
MPVYVAILNIPKHRVVDAFQEVYTTSEEAEYSFLPALIEGLVNGLRWVGTTRADEFVAQYEQAVGVRFEEADLFEDGRIVVEMADVEGKPLRYSRFQFAPGEPPRMQMKTILRALKEALIEQEEYELLAVLKQRLPQE